MNRKLTLLLSLLAATVSTAAPSAATAEGSKRIEVYTLAQSYYDTQHGDTLGEIVAELLPNNPGRHESLSQEIVGLNQDAFIDNNPDRLIAGKRLRLPGYLNEADTRVDPNAYTVESYSWGNIKRPR
jgi:Tfp pilus assembly protein FimV